MVEFKKCKKCNSNRVSYELIQNNVYEVMLSNKDPRTGTVNQNFLNVISAAHSKPELNRDGRPPCSMCLSDYGQMINDAVYSFKKQNHAK